MAEAKEDSQSGDASFDSHEAKTRDKSRFERANLLSKWTFAWVHSVVNKARSRKLDLAALDFPEPEHAETAHAAFANAWAKQTVQKKPSLVKALTKAFWPQMLIAGIWKLIWGAFVLLAAFYFVNWLVRYLGVRHALQVSSFPPSLLL